MLYCTQYRNTNKNISMITEQMLLSIYAILLVEIGLIFLIVLIILIDIKQSIDKVQRLVNRATNMADGILATVEFGEKQLRELVSFTGVFQSILNSVKPYVSWMSSSSSSTPSDESTSEENLLNLLRKSQQNDKVKKVKKRII